MNPQKRHEIFSRLREHIKQPRSELEYGSNFELLIAVLLSAQATDVSVNKVTAKLFPKANTPEQMLALGEAGVKRYIKSIGLFNSKAKNILGWKPTISLKEGLKHTIDFIDQNLYVYKVNQYNI